jgi:hypothetical protein
VRIVFKGLGFVLDPYVQAPERVGSNGHEIDTV